MENLYAFCEVFFSNSISSRHLFQLSAETSDVVPSEILPGIFPSAPSHYLVHLQFDEPMLPTQKESILEI